MKKIYLLSIFIFFVSLVVSAQDSKYGLIGGLNYSNVLGDINQGDSDYRSSFHIGAFAEFPISEKIAFAPQIIYSSQGYKNSSNDFNFGNIESSVFAGDSEYKGSRRLNYLNMPLLFKFNLTRKFSLDVGPQVGFLINDALVVEKEEGILGLNQRTRDNNGGAFKLDYGLKLGVSYDINKKMFLQLDYFYGLSNIAKGNSSDIYANNSVFNLSVGYSLF